MDRKARQRRVLCCATCSFSSLYPFHSVSLHSLSVSPFAIFSLFFLYIYIYISSLFLLDFSPSPAKDDERLGTFSALYTNMKDNIRIKKY